MQEPKPETLASMEQMVETYCNKTGTCRHPDTEVTDAVIKGLASHRDSLGKPLCPCRFYQDKEEEVQHRTWICPCDDMQIYKYCHCLLFVKEDGMPITEHLPEDHDGRQSWGLIEDDQPDKGRPKRRKAPEREQRRAERD